MATMPPRERKNDAYIHGWHTAALKSCWGHVATASALGMGNVISEEGRNPTPWEGLVHLWSSVALGPSLHVLFLPHYPSLICPDMLPLGTAAFSQPAPCPLMSEGLRIILSFRRSMSV